MMCVYDMYLYNETCCFLSCSSEPRSSVKFQHISEHQYVRSHLSPEARLHHCLQPSNVSEGMRQAATRLSSGFEEMGAALKAPFQADSGSPEASGGGLGTATVKALRAAPGALAKPLSGGERLPLVW